MFPIFARVTTLALMIPIIIIYLVGRSGLDSYLNVLIISKLIFLICSFMLYSIIIKNYEAKYFVIFPAFYTVIIAIDYGISELDINIIYPMVWIGCGLYLFFWDCAQHR